MKKIKTGSIIVNPTDLLQGSVQDQIEDRSIYLRSDDNISWTGTQLEFTTDIVLDIINSASGTVKSFTIAAAQSPVVLADSESAYISIDRTTSGAATIVKSGTTAIPAHSNADKDIFILFRRKDTAGADKILHIPLHKQAIEEGQSVRLGASGAGGGAGGGLDTIHTQDFETTAVASFTSGLNATYKTAGTFGGTLADETTNPISGAQSPKYTAGVTSTNDWFDVETITLDDKQRSEDIGITLYADMSNFSADVEFVVWDNTNSAKLNSSLDILKGGSAKSRYSFSVYIPSTTASISYGFHMVNAPVSTESFIIDDFEFTLNPFVYKNLVDISNYKAVEPSNTMSNLSGQMQFSGAVTETSEGNFYNYLTVDHSTDPSTYTAKKDVSLNVSAKGISILQNHHMLILVDGGIYHSSTQAYAASSTNVVSSPVFLKAGEVMTISAGTIAAPTSASFASSTADFRLVISVVAETEHVITPAKAGTEVVYYEGYLGLSGNFVKLKTEVLNTASKLLSVDNTSYTKYTALQPCTITATVSGEGVVGMNHEPRVYNSSAVLQASARDHSDANQAGSASFTYELATGDYVVYDTGASALNDAATSTFTIKAQPVEATFLAAVPTAKWQTKKLSADVTTTTDISDLTFNNLIIGKPYRVSGVLTINSASTGDALIRIYDASGGGGNIVLSSGNIYNGSTGTGRLSMGVSDIFIAQTSSIYVRSLSSGGGSILGSGTRAETHITLEELPYHKDTETSQW